VTDVRRARRRDLATLVELHRAFCEIDGHPFDRERARAAFGPLLDDDTHGVVWIVDRPGAYAVLTWGWSIEAGGAEAVLDEIFTTERAAGIGSELLTHVIRDAEQRGLARVFLETELPNERVRGFYERHGFTADDSVWMSIVFTDLS
jgi:GNAT superfamily N-acetyltransferase